MIETIESGGVDIFLLNSDGLIVGMPTQSLHSHMEKHPDIAGSEEEYLSCAANVLRRGDDYKNGKIHDGVFVGGYNSSETGFFIVNTVHRKFD